MKIFHDPGFIRIHILHSIACQIPMDVSKAFYDLASGWRQNNEATVFLFRYDRGPELWSHIFQRFPRRFPITVTR